VKRKCQFGCFFSEYSSLLSSCECLVIQNHVQFSIGKNCDDTIHEARPALAVKARLPGSLRQHYASSSAWIEGFSSRQSTMAFSRGAI
jgi:hypothetical protein